MMKRDGSLLNRLLEPVGLSADRRLSPRYPAVQNRAYLGWRNETETREHPARLLNLSNGGVLIATETSPKPGQTVWVRLEDPAPTGWIAATIVGVERVPGLLWFRKPSFQVRLNFIDSCPYDFFKSATHGNQLDATEPDPVLPEHDNRYWR